MPFHLNECVQWSGWLRLRGSRYSRRNSSGKASAQWKYQSEPNELWFIRFSLAILSSIHWVAHSIFGPFSPFSFFVCSGYFVEFAVALSWFHFYLQRLILRGILFRSVSLPWPEFMRLFRQISPRHCMNVSIECVCEQFVFFYEAHLSRPFLIILAAHLSRPNNK